MMHIFLLYLIIYVAITPASNAEIPDLAENAILAQSQAWTQWAGVGYCRGGKTVDNTTSLLAPVVPHSACILVECAWSPGAGRPVLIESLSRSFVDEQSCSNYSHKQIFTHASNSSFKTSPPMKISVVVTVCSDCDDHNASLLLDVVKTLYEVPGSEIVVTLPKGVPLKSFREVLEQIDSNMRLYLPHGPSMRMLEVASDDPPAKVLHDVISRIGGTLLVLLSSAARVTPGWLAALHNTAATHPRAGIVGPLVLYPNLNIAEAGSIVHESGLRRFAYRGRSVLMVSMMHVRSVDFFSGMGAVMVNKAVFLDLVRDVDPITDMSMLMFDVSMKFLHAGYRTILQPFSVVIIPYNSARSVLTCRGPASMKQFQNFVVDRYPDVAKNHCPSSCLPQAKSSMDAVYSSMLGLSKVHMLYLDEIVPETDRDSGSIRLFEMLRVLRHTLDIDVTFQSMQLRDVKYLFPVLNLGINVVPRETLKRAVGYFARATRSRGFCPYDVILMARVDVAKYFYNPIKALCPDAPIIFDTVDIVHIREQRLFDLGLLQANLKKSRERKSLVRRMNSTKHMELFFLSESQVSFVVSTFEYKALLPMFQDSPQRLRILSNIYPEPAITEESPADFARRSGALFVGNMCHHPNSDAVKLISQQVLTELRLSSVDALNFRMHFVVSNLKICPNTNLMESIANNSMIVIHRDISDETLYELHRQVRLFLAPLRAGAGVKGKLNMALWLGLPIIASSMASEGMGLVDGESMMLASTSKEFADAVSRLYGDFDMWSRLRRGGYEINKKFYSRGLATKVLNETLTYLGVMGKPRRGCLLSSNRSAQILQEDTEGDAVLSCLDANAVKGFPFVAPFDQYSLSTHIGEIRDASNGILQQNATTVT